jgi:hypothetical protein
MNRLKNYVLILFLSAFAVNYVFAQENKDEDDPGNITIKPHPVTLRLDFSVPAPLNSAWRKCMVGIGGADLSGVYRVSGNFFMGLGYKANILYTPPKFFVFDVKTKMQMHNVYLHAGFDSYRSNTFFISPSIGGGYTFTKYSYVQPKVRPFDYKPVYDSPFFEAKCNLTWITEKNMGLSFNFSLVYVAHVWDPDFIFMDEWIQLGNVSKSAPTIYADFGLGLYFGLGKGKTKAVKSGL